MACWTGRAFAASTPQVAQAKGFQRNPESGDSIKDDPQEAAEDKPLQVVARIAAA